jgi:hypothetical protein
MDKYIRYWAFFYWNNAKDLSNTANIFEQFFDGDIVLEILNETSHYIQHFKYCKGCVVYMCSRVNELQCDSRSMYFTGIFLTFMCTVQKSNLRWYFSWIQLVALPVFGSFDRIRPSTDFCIYQQHLQDTWRTTKTSTYPNWTLELMNCSHYERATCFWNGSLHWSCHSSE